MKNATLKFYRFISDNKLELNSDDKDHIVLFVNYFLVESFYKILASSIFYDEGLESRMKEGYLAIKINKILEHYNIDLEDII